MYWSIRTSNRPFCIKPLLYGRTYCTCGWRLESFAYNSKGSLHKETSEVSDVDFNSGLAVAKVSEDKVEELPIDELKNENNKNSASSNKIKKTRNKKIKQQKKFFL